jgi:arginine/ornithine N-succinyltransferase beta subunit
MKLYDEFSEFTIRDADIYDLDAVYKLSNILNTVTLPANKIELEKIILSSMSSFSLSENRSYQKNIFILIRKLK